MSNIINLNSDAKSAQEIQYRSAKTDYGQSQRAEALHQEFARKARLNEYDREKSARNLHNLLEEWRTAPEFDQKRFLELSGLQGNGGTDSTKRLHTYTLPEEASDARKKGLVKKASQYLPIAQAAAKLFEVPDYVILCRIFQGCSIGMLDESKANWEGKNWSSLANLLENMAAAVIRDHNVDEYFRKVNATNGAYDVRNGSIRPAPRPLNSIKKGYGLAGGDVHYSEVMPIPSIVVGRRRQGAPIEGAIAFQSGERLELELTFWLEVRLALGPVNSSSENGPLIEVRTILEGTTREGEVVTFDNPYTDTTDKIRTANIGGSANAIQGIALNDYDLLPPPEYRTYGEHSYFAWHEASPANLCRFLDPEDLKRTGEFQAVNRNSRVYLQDPPANRFDIGSAAAVLYTDLLTGKIEGELAAVCDALNSQLDAWRAAQEEDIHKGEAEAVARWAKAGSTDTALLARRQEDEVDLFDAVNHLLETRGLAPMFDSPKGDAKPIARSDRADAANTEDEKESRE